MNWEDDDDEQDEEEPRFKGRRVCNIGANVAAWSEATNGAAGSSWWDLCLYHANYVEQHPHVFDASLTPWNGDPPGEDGRAGDAAHPDYNDDEYRCALPECQVLLGGW